MDDEYTPYGLADAENAITDVAAEEAHARLKDAVSGAVKKITDDLHESIHDYVMYSMESDMRYNFSDLVLNRCKTIIAGLLSGQWNEATAKKWLEGYDFEKYRKDIYIANKDIIQNKLIDDLMKDNERLTKDVEYYRRRDSDRF